MELNPQSVPAPLVAFLLSNCKVDQEVFTRTVLSLAQDGWLEIIPQDQAHLATMVRIKRDPDWHLLSTVEGLAFERVRTAMRDLPAAPLSALTSDEGQDYAAWSAKFEQAILNESKAEGLIDHKIRPILADTLNVLISIAAAGVIALAARVGHWSGNPIEFAVVVLFATGFVGRSIFKPFVRLRPTARGRAVAAWWREHGTGIGGAVLNDRPAVGTGATDPAVVAPPSTAEILISQGTQPLPPDHVWSSLGGQWRAVKVGKVNDRARRRRQGGRVQFDGQVVKRWSKVLKPRDDEERIEYFCCIDDGRSDEAWTFEVYESSYHKGAVGNLVAVDHNPKWYKLGGLASLERIPEQQP